MFYFIPYDIIKYQENEMFYYKPHQGKNEKVFYKYLFTCITIIIVFHAVIFEYKDHIQEKKKICVKYVIVQTTNCYQTRKMALDYMR